MVHVFASILLLCTYSTTWGGTTYELSDLEVLAAEGSHEEFFKHALDVRPSERQGPWKSMVSKMADAYAQSITARPEIKASDYLQVEKLYQWPGLRTDDVFKLKRQEIGLRYLSVCVKTETPCWNELKTFWEADNTDHDTAYKLAELVANTPNSPLVPWTFLEVALKGPLSEFYCKKELGLKELWSKLEVDYIRLGPKGDLMKKIDSTVHPDCLPSLIKEARTRLMSPEKVNDRELAFGILKSQLKADQRLSDFFHAVYLLERPSQGELFNYSWNRVKELGSSFARREAVLAMLKTLDPLPDELFTSMDETKKRVVLMHFKSHFPEYLDFYADQCVRYYGGKGEFPKGNPAIHCQDLMNSTLARELIDSFKLKQYQDIRKI